MRSKTCRSDRRPACKSPARVGVSCRRCTSLTPGCSRGIKAAASASKGSCPAGSGQSASPGVPRGGDQAHYAAQIAVPGRPATVPRLHAIVSKLHAEVRGLDLQPAVRLARAEEADETGIEGRGGRGHLERGSPFPGCAVKLNRIRWSYSAPEDCQDWNRRQKACGTGFNIG